jgi:hypothetical protein
MRLAVRLCPTALPGVKQLDQVPTFRIFRGANLVSSRRRRRVIALIRTYLLVASVALSHAATLASTFSSSIALVARLKTASEQRARVNGGMAASNINFIRVVAVRR